MWVSEAVNVNEWLCDSALFFCIYPRAERADVVALADNLKSSVMCSVLLLLLLMTDDS